MTRVKLGALALVGAFFLASCFSSEKKEDPPAEQPQATTAEPAQEPQVTSTDHSAEAPRWGYEGTTGPDSWGSLDPAWALCSGGTRQSPVNLVWKRPKKGGDLRFEYQMSPLRVVDNGHTIQINVSPGSKAWIRGEEYELEQFHFHSGSEHTLSDNRLPLEAHFVHRNRDGELAVVAVFIIQGASNEIIDQIWTHIPPTKGKEVEVTGAMINPRLLIPKTLTYYHYTGSMTTPPCSEGVNWNVLNTPIQVSKDQILAFRKFYSYNARPVQPLNGREVVNY